MFHLIKAPFWNDCNDCTELGIDSMLKILTTLSYYVACFMYALKH